MDRLKDRVLMVFGLIFLAGCAVGPDYHPMISKGSMVRASLRESIAAQWQEMFKSDDIDALIRSAIKGSPTIVQSEAALREARENLSAREGTDRYPSLDADLSGNRRKTSPSSFGTTQGSSNVFSLYNASVNVSYAFDVFGGGRREVEALTSEVNYANFQLEGAYLTLTSNVVTAAIREAALRAELNVNVRMLLLLELQLGLLKKQLQLGSITRTEVLSQYALVEQTRAGIPTLQKELAFARHQLAVLMGKTPSDLRNIRTSDLDLFHFPKQIPKSFPSVVVDQRPDVRAAEAILHSASARLGVATANLYPQFLINGAYGPQSLRLSGLFDVQNMVWNVGGSVLSPLFNGGSLRAKRRAAAAAYDQAAAYFRQTVLLAYQNIADALRALESDGEALRSRQNALLAAHESLLIMQDRFRSGAVNRMLLLDADRQYQQVSIAVIQARAAQYADGAALFQALGGSWWILKGEMK